MPAPTFALVIGIDDYSVLDRSLGRPQGSNDLHGALNDVAAMARLVRMMDVPAGNIRVLTTPLHGPNAFQAVAVGRYPVPGQADQPTFTATGHDAIQPIKMEMTDATFGYASRQDVLDGLAWLGKRLEESPGSNGIIYFSGHSIITEQGHLCLCPSDTLKGAAPEPVVDVVYPDAVNGYLRRVAYLAALDEVIGSDDPTRLFQLTEELQRAFRKGCDPGALVRECAERLGLEVNEEGVRKFVADVPVLRGDDTVDQLEWVLEKGALTKAAIASIVHGDPFAEATGYRNLISFNKAFFQMLRDVPADRSIHIILDTCMSGPQNQQLHRQYLDIQGCEVVDGETIWCTGIPQANSNMMMLLSSLPENTSHRAVFDNRWYGAFTWALVTLLGRVPVLVTDQGRCFDIKYGELRDQIASLLSMMSCEQRPDVWTGNWKDWTERGFVFGTLHQRTVVEQTLLPVRVKEEIDAGTSGCVYQIGDAEGQFGYLVIIRKGENIGRWKGGETGREYWIWQKEETSFPKRSFTLIPPIPLQGVPPSTKLSRCLEKLGKNLDSSSIKMCDSKEFIDGNSTGIPPESFLYGIYKVVGDKETFLGYMAASSDRLIWKAAAASLKDKWLNFADGGSILPDKTTIDFRYIEHSIPIPGDYKECVDDYGQYAG